MNLMPQYTVDQYKEAVKRYESRFEYYYSVQVRNPDSPKHGGQLSYLGVVTTESVNLMNMACIYFCKESKYYHSTEAFAFFDANYIFLGRVLRPQGLIDYHLCNFYSAPDTAFALIAVAKTYRYSLLDTPDENGVKLQAMLLDIIRRYADGILVGGFHTPNHRWVESAALSMAINILGDTKYQKRIDDFLLEGIDCSEDGEFTERSAGTYNYVSDNALLIVAKEQNRPDLLQYVRRNLLMMTYYFDNDFRIFTLNSTRQDNGTTVYADKYLPLYLACGNALQDKELLSIGRAIHESILQNGRPYPIHFYEMALDADDLAIPDDVEPYIIADYNRYFRGSKLIRMNRGGMFATVMEDADIFFFLNYKNLDMYIKGGIHFFNERHLRVKNVVPTENGYEMTFHGEGVYYLPYGYYPGTTDYASLDREQRDKTDTYTVDIKLKVEMDDDGYRITASSEGMDRVLVRFEMGFLPNILVFTKDTVTLGKAGARNVICEGDVDVTNSDLAYGLKIGPAFADHFATKGLFGANPVSESRHNLFFSAVTPFEKSFTIKPNTSVNDISQKKFM